MFVWAQILVLLGLVAAAAWAMPVAKVDEELHAWPIDEAESQHLSKILGVDFKTLNIAGTKVDGPKQDCVGCGKTSGLDDFVANALEDKIHTREFMVRALKERFPNASPRHDIRCSGCGTKFLEKRGWGGTSNFNWTYDTSGPGQVESYGNGNDNDNNNNNDDNGSSGYGNNDSEE